MTNRFSTSFIAALALFLASANIACAADLKDFEPRQYKDADGNVLLYRLYKPKEYDANKKYPLILFLHGAGERGNNNTAQVRDALHWARDEVQKENPCFILAPQCPGARQSFQLYGTRKESDQSFANYERSAGEWKTFSIPLSRITTGAKSYLALVNAADRKATSPAMSEFRNLKIHEEGATAAAPLDLRKLDFSKPQGNGKLTVSEDGATITLEGDVRIKAPFAYTVTPTSLLEFEFRSTAHGLTHSISLDTDDFFDYRWANMDWSAKKGAAGK